MRGESGLGMAGTDSMKQACQGSCHCGAVRFECDLDLAQGSRKCNCTFCTKTRFWKAFADNGSFRLLRGQDVLAAYTFGPGMAAHCFCRHCGVNLFLHVDLGDGQAEHVVNLAVVDDPVMLDEAMNARVIYEDGRNDDWWSAPAHTRHL